MPKPEQFATREEMDRTANLLKSEGDLVLAEDSPEVGVLAYNVMAMSGRPNRRLMHLPYGKYLLPDLRLTRSVDEFLGWVRQHQTHPRMRHNDTRSKQLGVVCYCQASEGTALVFRIAVEYTRHASGSDLSEIIRAIS